MTVCIGLTRRGHAHPDRCMICSAYTLSAFEDIYNERAILLTYLPNFLLFIIVLQQLLLQQLLQLANMLRKARTAINETTSVWRTNFQVRITNNATETDIHEMMCWYVCKNMGSAVAPSVLIGVWRNSGIGYWNKPNSRPTVHGVS